MIFNKSNRKLVSSTGYLKATDGSVCESPIYLGIYDSENNYEEVEQDAYEAYKQAEEAKANKIEEAQCLFFHIKKLLNRLLSTKLLRIKGVL